MLSGANTVSKSNENFFRRPAETLSQDTISRGLSKNGSRNQYASSTLHQFLVKSRNDEAKSKGEYQPAMDTIASSPPAGQIDEDFS